MVFKNFRWQVVFRVILIGFLLAGFVYSLSQDRWYVTSVILLLLSVLFIIELIYYVDKTRRELSKFLFSIKNHDFMLSGIKDDDFLKRKNYLKNAFTEIIDEFQQVKIDREIHYRYLQTIIEHVDTALICFDSKDDIALINQAAKGIIESQNIKNLQQLQRIIPDLGNILQEIRAGEQKLLRTKSGGGLVQLAIRATEFKIQDESYKLISLQDIKSELESQELESWQRLIRVLTHEIMNSVTPISSLSIAVNEILEENSDTENGFAMIDQEDANDIRSSMKTIQNRSKGLLSFVETYKDLTRLPKPSFEKINSSELLNHVRTLLKSDLERASISFGIRNDIPGDKLLIDHDMVVRVLINLILNSIDAISDRLEPMVEIHMFKDESNRINLFVKDNGGGMDQETLDNIFVPFFTTKEKGSGIGLSLSRQIMNMHKGSISVESREGEGTVVVLKF